MLELVNSDRMGAIASLLTEFCWCADHGEGERIASLFTESAFIKTPYFEARGLDEIRAAFVGRAPKLSRHHWTNLRVEARGDDRFMVESYMINATGPLPAPQSGGQIAMATANDEIVFRDGMPLFASRTLTIAFEGRIAPKEVQA